MNQFNPTRYQQIGKSIESIFEDSQTLFELERQDHIRHYLNNNEYEIALESLILSSLSRKESIDCSVFSNLENLASELNLDNPDVAVLTDGNILHLLKDVRREKEQESSGRK